MSAHSRFMAIMTDERKPTYAKMTHFSFTDKNKYRENPNGAAYLISHKVNNNKYTTSNTRNLELPNTKVGQVFFSDRNFNIFITISPTDY